MNFMSSDFSSASHFKFYLFSIVNFFVASLVDVKCASIESSREEETEVKQFENAHKNCAWLSFCIFFPTFCVCLYASNIDFKHHWKTVCRQNQNVKKWMFWCARIFSHVWQNDRLPSASYFSFVPFQPLFLSSFYISSCSLDGQADLETRFMF